ncbi:MAG: tRNA lysidine(34) synthetase TilS [Chlamydiae bacterium RIFCSPHIGHO2_12_FULL_49_11]|nr:MAG: tRNA lysidine(34) synthetase TilS [Chlamydiae bacterium RIFCSPHIGHO2_12_FULL_49_11]
MNDAKNFLLKQGAGKRLLLALSGGPDSMALFYLLFELELPFAVCHINHGIREESPAEEEYVRKLCEEKGIPAWIERIFGIHDENGLRKARRRIFYEICVREKFDLVLLGHQREDQAETVLKRVLEGAGWTKFSGMKELTEREARPLLHTSKKEIYEYHKKAGTFFFEDRTNAEGGNLRSRMRCEIIPFLETAFGKNPMEPLLRLSRRAARFEEFIRDQISAFPILENRYGFAWFDAEKAHPFLFEEAVRFLVNGRKLVIAEIQWDALQKGALVQTKGWKACIERGHFFFLDLREGPFVGGDGGWQKFFSPERTLLGPSFPPVPLSTRHISGKTLAEHYRIHGVPKFFRKVVGVELDKEKEVALRDYLT